jgi:muramoyltetrapeptide carboxypeptidase
MTTIYHLNPGDTVDIIAPSSKCAVDTIPKVAKLLTSWGLKPHISEDILGDDLLCANSDEMRFHLLKESLLNKNSKAIWCLRGGYGSARLIPMLETIVPPPQQKMFIGFSDTTALHIFFQQKWGWQTVHGSTANQTANHLIDDTSIQKLKDLILGHTEKIEFQLTTLNDAAKKLNKISAPMVGGNLTLIECSLSTSWQLDTKNKIILLEDVNMPAYQIDRSLIHLKQANLLQHAKAIILGEFMGRDKEKDAELIEKTLVRFANEVNIPVLKTAEIGHGIINYPLPLAMPATLEMGKNLVPTLTI